MSSPGKVIDLSDDTAIANEPSKKRKAEHSPLKVVWIAFHQLESAYGQIGDFENDTNGFASHTPTEFDKTILGIFITRAAANECANEQWREINGDDDEEEDDDGNSVDIPDFVGEGRLIDGSESGDVNTFSQRVVVEMMEITQR